MKHIQKLETQIGMENIKIFVIHYTKLKYRKTHILQQLAKHNITDFEFIESSDPDNLNPYLLSRINNNLKIGQISIICKHLECYNTIANGDYDKYKYFLILEDDVIFHDNFVNILQNYLSQLPDDYDMLFIGDGCQLHINPILLKPNCNIYLNPFGQTRCADSYFISKECIAKILSYFSNMKEKMYLTIDHWMNKVARDNNFKYYWAEPTIVTQGSQNGLFKTEY